MLEVIQQFIDENPSFDKKEFVKFIEGAYDSVYSNKCKGKLPPLKVNPAKRVVGGFRGAKRVDADVNRDDVAGEAEAKPKRLPTAYQSFQKVQQAKVKDANPNMKPTEVMKEVARRWNLQKAGIAEEEWEVNDVE